MAETEAPGQANQDVHVRELFDRMTRSYLRSVLSDELIAEHARGDHGHVSEQLARLLAWCQRRPPEQQYAVKAEADGSFRLIRFAGRRGQKPAYVGDERFATVQAARHGAFLRHVQDLTEK